jgi:hypothetical protein
MLRAPFITSILIRSLKLVHILNPLIVQSSPSPYHFLPLWTKFSPNRPLLNQIQSEFFLLRRITKIHTYIIIIIIIIIIISSGTEAQRGLWLPRPHGFLITHNDAAQSVGLL